MGQEHFENTEENLDQLEQQVIRDMGSVLRTRGPHAIHCLTVVGTIEGHVAAGQGQKTTRYEHVIPQLVDIQEDPEVEGLLVILNTVGGDVEAGLALAELISGITKPSATLVLGGGHSIGIPLAVSARRSFIVPTATMTLHPVRHSGLVLGVPQTLRYFEQMQQRITGFVAGHSQISARRFNQLMMRTGELVMDVSRKVRELPAVAHVLSLSGYDLINSTLDTGAGTLFIQLKPWGEREKEGLSLADTRRRIYALGLQESRGVVLPFNPPPIMGMSNTGGFEMEIQTTSGTPAELAKVASDFAAKASKRPELARVSSAFSVGSPRLFVELDREKAMMSGVNCADVYNMLGATLGSTYINDFNLSGRTFKVMMQADAPYRSLPDSMRSLYVSTASGGQIPLTSLVTVKTSGGPSIVSHFNGLMSAKITGSPAPGVSSGQAIAALEEAASSLPQGYSYAWSGVTYQEVATGGTDFGVLGLSVLMIFLILAAQYERWSLPMAVLSAVPFAVFGAIFGNWLVGLSNDIYTQVAIITLLGLACKNAILIIEFAVELRAQGRGLEEAAVEAAKLRFRPIIMTSIAFILGCLPLAFSSGAGAASRVSIGVSVVCGMIAATVLAPLLVPYFFVLVMRLSERLTGASRREEKA